MVFLRRPPLPGFAAAHQDEVAEFPVLGNLGAGLGAHEVIEPARKLALARLGKGVGQELGDGEPQHAVAEEFETLIVLVGPGARLRALAWVKASLSSAGSEKSCPSRAERSLSAVLRGLGKA